MSKNGYSGSKKRGRVYKRKFDWDEARRLYDQGLGYRRLAQHFGVNKNAIRNVIKKTALPEYVAQYRPSAYDKYRDACPACGGPKGREAVLCLRCHQEGRLTELLLEKVPGRKRIALVGVPTGGIVRFDDEWGVLVSRSFGRCLIDFWDTGLRRLAATEQVELAPSLRVFVDGTEQEPEQVT